MALLDKVRGNTLVNNTIMLYILTFSSQLINLALIPYETRTLGPVAFGVITLAVSMSMILTIVLDFGFLLSATERVVESEGDPKALSDILVNVTLVKCVLALVAGGAVIVLVAFVEPFCEYPDVFIWYYIAYVFNALLPDYLYRGMERMKSITVRTLAIRVGFAIPIFFFLKTPADITVIPCSLAVGNLAALLFSFAHVHNVFNVTFVLPSVRMAGGLAKRTIPFFISRFASTFYQSLNAVLLGYLYPGSPVVGKYGAADKFLSVSKSISSPIADSLYPYMIRTKNYALCRKILLASIPLILGAGVFTMIWADQICQFVFGSGYEGTGILLRCLTPAMMVILPTYIICFPVLVPLGLSRYANRSNIVGAIVQLVLLGCLLITGNLTALSLCISTSISEVAVFVFRLYAAAFCRSQVLESAGKKGSV